MVATLKIDNKWSVRYDPDNNDRPTSVLRYNEPVGPFVYDNVVVDMLYALLEVQNKLQTDKKIAELIRDNMDLMATGRTSFIGYTRRLALEIIGEKDEKK